VDGPFKGQEAPGIDEPEGDTRQLPYAVPDTPAPTDFSARPGSEQMVFVMKRRPTGVLVRSARHGIVRAAR
jgi:hypothetical protein